MFGNGRNQLVLTLFTRTGAHPLRDTSALRGASTLACRGFAVVIDPGDARINSGTISTAWCVANHFQRLIEGPDFIPQIPDDCNAYFPISLGRSLHL